MTFQQAVRTVVLEKYADFNGRARRSEFWWYALFAALVGAVASVLDALLFDSNLSGGQLTPIRSLVNLALLLPGLAVGARRLHDTGRSGWWQLIALTVIGVIVLIVWWVQDSKPETNQHGPSPKGEALAYEAAPPVV